MINKDDFLKMAGKENVNEKLTKREMIELLRKLGGSINSAENVKYILKEYFDVEVGDTIICTGNHPDESKKMIMNGKSVRVYKITDIFDITLFRPGMRIDYRDNEGEHYTGANDLGIFYFFIDTDFDILKDVI